MAVNHMEDQIMKNIKSKGHQRLNKTQAAEYEPLWLLFSSTGLWELAFPVKMAVESF